MLLGNHEGADGLERPIFGVMHWLSIFVDFLCDVFAESKRYFPSLNLTQMELYPHNQKAYESIVEIFKTGNLACSVQPCGTGKSMLIAKCIVDNPNKTHLLLAPGEHIKHEIKKHINGTRILFSTYAGLKSSDLFIFHDAIDFIYADEIHRLGADDWGPVFLKLLDLCPKAKVVGTTATPIRYLDGWRNMANEIFKGRIASEMSLASALAQGILPRPIYRRAIYSCKERLEKLMRELGPKARRKLSQELDAHMIDWENAEGVGKMIKDNLTPERRRVIVFCKNVEHMLLMQRKLEPVFETIYGAVQCVAIHSKFKSSKNGSAMDDFSGEDDRAVVLFTVDMVNEGLHSKYCNTVILLRDTQSPILFYQQIGRGFSANGIHRPLIIDVVNNFKMLAQLERDILRESGSSRKAKPHGEGSAIKMPIEVIDEVLDIERILLQYEAPSCKEPETIAAKEVVKDKTRLEVEACMDRLVAHFKEGGIDTMTKETRSDFTRIQFRCQQSGLWPGDLARLNRAGVPIEMTQSESDWLDKAQRVLKWFEDHRRLPGFGDEDTLYRFWLREDVNRGHKHYFKKFFQANIVADRVCERLQSIILEQRGLSRRDRRKKSKF